MKMPKYEPGQKVYWLNATDCIICAKIEYSSTHINSGNTFYKLSGWMSDFEEGELFESWDKAHKKFLEDS